jgi:hypothetical protein
MVAIIDVIQLPPKFEKKKCILGQCYWWRKPEHPEKTTNLSQESLINFHHIMLYRVHLAWAGFELTTLVVIGTDCIGSYKSIWLRPRRPLVETTNISIHFFFSNLGGNCMTSMIATIPLEFENPRCTRYNIMW